MQLTNPKKRSKTFYLTKGGNPRPQTERLARNPKTGTPVMIPARTTVKFKPGKYLLDAINKPEEKK